MISSGRSWLFSEKGALSDYLREREIELDKEVENFSSDYILSASESDLIDALIEKYTIEVPIVKYDALHLEGPDKEIKTIDGNSIGDFGEGPVQCKFHAATVVIPFTGDPSVFQYQPSTRLGHESLEGYVQGSEIRIRIEQFDADANRFRQQYDNKLGRFTRNLRNASVDLNDFNRRLKAIVQVSIDNKRRWWLQTQNLLAAIPVPVRKSGDIPQSFIIPPMRRKLRTNLPPTNSRKFEPEPAMPNDDYNCIIKVMHDMAILIEKNPRSFAIMSEEFIRDQFLYQLNVNFEGEAKGEVFNNSGSTDILIGRGNKNIFIAECKIWKGKKSLQGAINQLLRYLCWRDTKTAILLFCRIKDFSGVLRKVPEVMAAHPNCKRTLRHIDESTFQYMFHQNGDKNRELLLTVLAFNIPNV